MKRLIFLSCAFVMFTLLIACSSGNSSSQYSQGQLPQAQATQSAVKPVSGGWEQQWQNALDLARKEGKVVVNANIGSEIARPVAAKFKEKFGIDLEITTGRSDELTQRIVAQRRAGLYLLDVVWLGASTTIAGLKPSNAGIPLRPYLILPEVTDPKVWVYGTLPFVDKEESIFAFSAYPAPGFLTNTQLVKKGEADSYKDLLNPRWKGKIVMNDPTRSGMGVSQFVFVSRKIYNVDYWREFVKQEPMISADQRLPVEWVAKGKYAIGIGTNTAAAQEFIRAGAPLNVASAPAEGTYLSAGYNTLSVLGNPAHPGATTVFVNWLLGREAQQIIAEAVLLQSAREDIPLVNMDPERIRNASTKYYESESEESILIKTSAETLKLVKEIFAPVMK